MTLDSCLPTTGTWIPPSKHKFFHFHMNQCASSMICIEYNLMVGDWRFSHSILTKFIFAVSLINKTIWLFWAAVVPFLNANTKTFCFLCCNLENFICPYSCNLAWWYRFRYFTFPTKLRLFIGLFFVLHADIFYFFYHNCIIQSFTFVGLVSISCLVSWKIACWALGKVMPCLVISLHNFDKQPCISWKCTLTVCLNIWSNASSIY